MKIAICEDEKIYSDLLYEHLTKYFEKLGEPLETVVYTDGAPLVAACEEGKSFDIIFLDIQLECSDGVEVARSLRRLDDKVALVFVTGLDNRSIEGYEVNAFDYVVKATMKDRLDSVLDRFMAGRRAELLTVPQADGDTALVRHPDILWIESEGRGTRIVTRTGDIRSPQPVGKFAVGLPTERFVEIHKSVYVQIAEIRRIGTDTVEMADGSTLPISRRKRKSVMTAVMAAVKTR